MSESVRLLTWNVQMRSWGMETLADKSFPPSTTAEERAHIIADKLETSADDFDIVCLNEVFDEDSRDILEDRLCGAGRRFPYAVIKADLGLIRVRTGNDSATLDPAMWIDLLGLGGVVGLLQLLAGKFEDSGLMVLSRLPFARQPLPASFVPLLGTRIPAAWGIDGVPRVAFACYGASSDNDKLAAKGVVHAAFPLPPGTLHLFASHSQADSDASGENHGDREKQMATVGAFVNAVAGYPPLDDDAVLFCGDLNIVGGQADAPQPYDGEWRARFDTPGEGVLSDLLVEVWGREQCRGALPGTPASASGLRDLGHTAPVVYEPRAQRLDYFFRNPAGRLVSQHLRIHHELSLVPPGLSGIGYLSDHKPLYADLHRRELHNSPDRAKRLTANPTVDATGTLLGGLVDWYRFDEDGTYEFNLVTLTGGAPIGFEVYLDTDLSTPWPQFRREGDPERGQRWVVPSAPFLVKVLMTRRSEGSYFFRAYRHDGASRADFIELVPGLPRTDTFPAGQLVGSDDSATPWDDTDTRWYRVSAPTIELAQPVTLSLRVDLTAEADSGGFVRLLGEDGPNLYVLEDLTIDAAGLDLSWQSRPGEKFYVCVQRRDTGGVPLAARLLLTADFSVFRVRSGVVPRLVCAEETSGWGSDDISWTLRADGVEVAHGSNDDFGDMDDDDARDLQPWLRPGPVYYAQQVELEVREEDDIDPDDVGVIVIPAFDGFAAIAGVAVGPDGMAAGVVAAGVDDGRYELHCEVARWDPEA